MPELIYCYYNYRRVDVVADVDVDVDVDDDVVVVVVEVVRWILGQDPV